MNQKTTIWGSEIMQAFKKYLAFGIMWWCLDSFVLIFFIDMIGIAAWQFIVIFTVPFFLVKFIIYYKKIFRRGRNDIMGIS